MRITVKAKPKSKQEYVKRTGNLEVTVAVKAVAEQGKANEAIVQALAAVLNIPKSSIILISGRTSCRKVFEIPLRLEDLQKITFPPKQIELL